MNEILAARTEKAKFFAIDQNQRLAKFFTNPIHFDSGQGVMVEIDPTLADQGTTLAPTATAYSLAIEKQVSALEAPFAFTYGGLGVEFIPRGLRWDTQDVVKQDTEGTADADAKFAGAYGEFGDLIIKPTNTGVQKLVQINSLPATPEGAVYLEAGFELIAPDGFELWYQSPDNQASVDSIRDQLKALNTERLALEKDKKYGAARAIHSQQTTLEENLHDAMLSKLDKATDTKFTGEWQIRLGDKKIYGRPIRAWNAKEARLIEAELRLRNGKFYLAKLVPVDFLNTFPVFTDTTTSYFSGAGDGHVRNLGGVAVAWATVRAATDGTFADYTGASLRAGGTDFASEQYDIWRGFLPVDTSAIPDNATISAASVNLHEDDGSAITNVNTTDIDVVATTQASTTQLVVGDFDQVGSTVGGSIAISGISADSDFAITLDATGIGFISLTGVTKIGFRNSRDTDNSAPTGSNNINVESSENAGTADDPFLSVTYTVPATFIPSIIIS